MDRATNGEGGRRRPPARRRSIAEAVASRLVHGIAALGVDFPGVEIGASLGIAFLDEPPESADEALRIADAAMYTAKAAGTGRIAVSCGTRQPPALLAHR